MFHPNKTILKVDFSNNIVKCASTQRKKGKKERKKERKKQRKKERKKAKYLNF